MRKFTVILLLAACGGCTASPRADTNGAPPSSGVDMDGGSPTAESACAAWSRRSPCVLVETNPPPTSATYLAGCLESHAFATSRGCGAEYLETIVCPEARPECGVPEACAAANERLAACRHP